MEILRNVYGPFDAEQVYYPNSEDHNTHEILKNIQRGVIISVRPNGDIYVTRLCRARVYVGEGPMSTPKVLTRQQETLVYSFQNDFLPQLLNYQNGLSFEIPPPCCERYFSLGEKWSPNTRPLKEMLTRFSLTHFLAKKIFKEIKEQKPLIEDFSKSNSLDIIHKTLVSNNFQQRNM